MPATLEDRVTVLEVKMERMEANPQPGQNKAFSDSLKEIRAVQDQHTMVLRRHSKMLDDLLLFVCNGREDLQEFRIEVNDFKAEVTSDIGMLKTDVSGLKTDVSGLKTDVSGLKADVAELRTDMTEVKGTLALILDRLPAKSA
jgi:prophage DNA circulation protein